MGDLAPVALSALERSGTLAVAGIPLSDIPVLNYAAYPGEVSALPLQVRVNRCPFSRADQALPDLAADRVTGVAVLSGEG